ncbi:MAG: hypothetical protein JO341_14520 [Gammaproteobacteria bacterium]|nr:hypothetical protein [Gammaproteobacteria bacterium]MBV9622220.1 hypothetical protein [Gammaproteobacteria bacterium]
MKAFSLTSIGLAAALALALGGCNHAKDESQVAKDTAAAEQNRAENVRDAEHKADEKIADARKDVRSEERDMQHVAAVQGEKVEDTAAEGNHKVALAQCEALSGSAQKSCKDKADADYDLAKSRAKSERAASDPKP